jgi:nicotinate phosphoribosyltransferase
MSGIALTDTFSTETFLKDFDKDLATKCSGVRQDSGDPIAFVPRIVRHYKEHGVNPKDKTIVFSDSLDIERCLELKKWADKHGIGSSFGVGTFFTSNHHPSSLARRLMADDYLKKRAVEKSKPMNIVIKIRSADGQPCVKISDDLTKNTGLEDQVRLVKEQLGLLPRNRRSIDYGEKLPGA